MPTPNQIYELNRLVTPNDFLGVIILFHPETKRWQFHGYFCKHCTGTIKSGKIAVNHEKSCPNLKLKKKQKRLAEINQNAPIITESKIAKY